MSKIRNLSTIPSGLLAPNGYVDTSADPGVQATTRPPGSLLAPSPGYDSVRVGKNIFQGKGPTGGFRPMQFAEDVGGTGAALSVIPGQTKRLEATEFLQNPEGPVLIADRMLDPGYASMLHEGYNTLPDMGDRTPDRPLTRSFASWARHPIRGFESTYKENPAMALLGAIGALAAITYLVDDVEKEFSSRRGRGITGTTEASTAATGDVATQGVEAITDTTEKAIDTLENATNKAVEAITDTAKEAVDTVKSAAQ